MLACCLNSASQTELLTLSFILETLNEEEVAHLMLLHFLPAQPPLPPPVHSTRKCRCGLTTSPEVTAVNLVVSMCG